MSNKKQTALDWFFNEIDNTFWDYMTFEQQQFIFNQAKEMEMEQKGYTKEDVLKAGEMGEVCYLDTEHIVSYLDEAREENEQTI